MSLDLCNMPDSTHMTVKEVAEVISVSVPTIWRWVEKGTFPKPKKFSSRCTRWEAGAVKRAIGLQAGVEM